MAPRLDQTILETRIRSCHPAQSPYPRPPSCLLGDPAHAAAMQSPTKATSPLLLLIGAGPGIGRALATSFASGGHFTRILLCSRSARHLEEEKAAVESAIAASSSAEAVEVGTLALDLGDLDALPGKLAEVEREWLSGEKGGLGCVWHNAASIRFGEPLGAGVGEVEADVKVGCHPFPFLSCWSRTWTCSRFRACSTREASGTHPC